MFSLCPESNTSSCCAACLKIVDPDTCPGEVYLEALGQTDPCLMALTHRDSWPWGVQAPVGCTLESSCPLSYQFSTFSCHLFASDCTEAIPEEQLLSCGASDCLMATASTNSTQRPSQTLIYTLLGIYTGMCSRRAESQGRQT